MHAIGIDIGTTSICGVVIDTESGSVLRSRTQNSEAFLNSAQPWERIQNVEKIISLAKQITDELLDGETAAIGVTGQMHGILYLDADGRAVSPLYTWQDGRGNLEYKDGLTYAEFLGSCSGYGNVTDFYNRQNRLRPANAVTYCTVHDYFVMTLCGRKRPKIHVSDAASFGRFDLRTGEFDYDIDVEVSGSFETAGSYRGIPVSVAIGDNQASVFSALANEEDLLINIGTGSQVSVISENIIEGDDIETRPYFDGKYLIVGAALCGGRAYSILHDFYAQLLETAGAAGHDVYAVMEKLIAQRAEESTLRVDTRLCGTRRDPALCGSITGLRPKNFTPVDLTCGVLEGMIEELYQMYAQMDGRTRNIVGSGNGLRRNAALVKIAENRFGGTLKIPVHIEEAAYGAALFGLVSGGCFASAAEVQRLIKFE